MAKDERQTDDDDRPKPPTRLGVNGRRLWRRTVERFDLAEHELLLLEQACREADLCHRLEDELRGDDLTTYGSQGQTVANPLLSELRLHRTTLSALVARLGLPDDADDGRSETKSRSASARDLAAARWRRSA